MKNAPYNPRFIREKNRKLLKANLDSESGGVGFLGGIKWNKRTGNIVEGHQRIWCLDSLMRTKDYSIPVDVVDLDPIREKEQNVFQNNDLTQGEFDGDMLKSLFKGPDKIDHDKAGFDLGVMYQMFGEAIVHDDPAAMIEMAERVRKAKEVEEGVWQKLEERDTEHFHLDLIFKNHDQRAAFTEALGLPDNIFVDGVGLVDMLFVDGSLFLDLLAKKEATTKRNKKKPGKRSA